VRVNVVRFPVYLNTSASHLYFNQRRNIIICCLNHFKRVSSNLAKLSGLNLQIIALITTIYFLKSEEGWLLVSWAYPLVGHRHVFTHIIILVWFKQVIDRLALVDNSKVGVMSIKFDCTSVESNYTFQSD
jgi:hypothetical protein